MQSETLPVVHAVTTDHPQKRRNHPASIVRDHRLWMSIALLATILIVVSLGTWLAPDDPHALSGRPLEQPSATHPLGTNDIGQDLFSQLLAGGRASLVVGFGAAALSTAIAWALGLMSGLGQRWYAAVGGASDLFLALPFLPVTILIVAHLGPQIPVIAITLGLISWPTYARVIRARVATELTAGYVEAARATGAAPTMILLRHVLPATIPVAIAKFVLTVQSAIVIEASLAFLGLSDPRTVSWGGMIHRGVGYGLIFASGAWRWWLMPPIVCIALLVCAVALIGWTLEDSRTRNYR